jgi:hypothetical protein
VNHLPVKIIGTDITFTAVLDDGSFYTETWGLGQKPTPTAIDEHFLEFRMLAEQRNGAAAETQPAVSYYDPEARRKLDKRAAERLLDNAQPASDIES